jgi:hypothetical protein
MINKITNFTFLLFLCLFMGVKNLAAQNPILKVNVDTTAKKTTKKAKKKYPPTNPKVAARRSAMLPGWGQVYNHKVWKVPIVYAGLGTIAGIFINNITQYNRVRFATKVAYNMQNKKLLNPITWQYTVTDSSGYNDVYGPLKPLLGNVSSLVNYRSSFRQNIDYSVLAFVLMWGFQVADAAVDAHLSSFDVSPDLNVKVKPFIPNGNTLGLAFVMGKPVKRILPTF